MAHLSDADREKLRKRWPHMTDAQIDEYKESFAVFDVDGDGQISPEEVQITMKNLGFQKTLSQIEQIMSRVDTDKNGVIDFTEFVALMQLQRNETNELKRAFDVFDKDRNGEINADEIKEIFRDMGHPMTDEEIDFLFSFIDENQDGVIDFNEFQNMMRFGPPQLHN